MGFEETVTLEYAGKEQFHHNGDTRPWDDYPPFSRFGDPWEIKDGQAVDELLVAYRDNQGATLTEWQREWLLNLIENEDQLRIVCEGGAGEGVLVPRIHDFMMVRHRTPARLLDPEDAIDLASKHLVRLGAFRDRLVEEGEYDDDVLDAYSRYVDSLLSSEIRWVDKESATAGTGHFDGHIAVFMADSGARASGAAADQNEVDANEDLIGEMLAQHYGDLLVRLDLGEGQLPWADVRQKLARLSDWQFQPLLDFVLGPAFKDPFDGEPFYRLWEGGASMWIGEAAIEVRTDWAQRWPNSRYQD